MISSSRISERPRALAVSGLLVAIAVLIAAPGAEARTWPAPVGFLSDFAGVVDPATGDSIQALAAELREKTGAEIAIVTTQDLGGEEIEPAAVDLFAQWKIGKKGRDEGVLILLAVTERKIKIEVGYGLEGILPDGRCGAIIRQVMSPDLSQNRFGAGLLRGEEAIAGVIANDRGVTLDRGGRVVIPSSGSGRRGGNAMGMLLLIWLFVIVLSMVAARRRRARGWTGRRGWHDPWGGFGGGMGGMGGFGGFGGGGGGGGGFGGFGGGSSGGGGASGRF